MHSFIRTYPSAASAASSSQLSRLAAEEDENGSICCDIYIDGEENAQPQKGGSSSSKQVPLHVAAVLRGRGIEAERPPEPPKKRKCSCWCITLVLVGIVAAAVIIGVSVGVSKHKRHRPSVHLGPGAGGPSGQSSVTRTVPFAATAEVDMPPDRRLTCDALFGDEQELEKFVDRLEAAHTHKMAQHQVDEVVVTELQCNNISYPVPAETFLAGKPAPAAAASQPPASRRRLAGQQQAQAQGQAYKLTNRVSSSSSSGEDDGDFGSSEFLSGSGSSAPGPLVVTVQLEAKRREHLDKVPVISSHVEWVQLVSKAGAALAGQLLPEALAAHFSLGQGSCRTTSVQQLNVEIISSQIMYDDLLGPVAPSPGRKGYKGATVVTRTELDPLTGTVTESQTMRLPVLPDYLPELLPDFPTDKPEGDAGSSGDTAAAPAQAAPDTAEEQQPQPQTQTPAQQCTEACGLPNTAESACVEGVCRVVACSPGWEDCDGNPVNGCEANVLGFFSDDNHCGSCNRVCLSPLTCQLGKCAAKPLPGTTPSTGVSPSQPPAQPVTAEQPQQQEPTQQQQQQQPGGAGAQTKPAPEVKPAPEQPAKPAPGKEPAPQAPAKKPEQQEPQKPSPPTAAPAVPPAGPAQPKPETPTPPKPAVPAIPKPPAPTVTPTKPSKPPVTPPQPLPVLVTPRDDVAHVSPSQAELLLDVLHNDDLRGENPAAVKLSVVGQPAVGSVSVLPAEGATGPRLLFKQGKDRLEPGSEVEVYYTVTVPGHPTPAPATVLLLGSVAPSDSSLANCSTAAGATTPGTPVPGLTRKDDAAVSVRLPFAVRMYGGSYSTATISSNGWLSLGDSGAKEPCNVEGSWPNAACLGTGPVLAPFWDDLVTDQVLTHHDTKRGAFVVQWTNVMAPASQLPIGTFQAWLFPNGALGYVYRDLYGTEQALGSSAVVGVRGPQVKSTVHVNKLKSKVFEKAGAGADEHGSWLFSTALDDWSDYVTLLGIHRRLLSPGVAVISHPAAATGVPGKFKPWAASTPDSSSTWPLLASPDAPERPVLQPLVAAPPSAATGKRVVTLSWQLPGEKAHTRLSPTFYKLFLAADPHFNELLRRPQAVAFQPDIPANSRSVDVQLSGRHSVNEVYALLMACNGSACSRSCIGHFTL